MKKVSRIASGIEVKTFIMSVVAAGCIGGWWNRTRLTMKTWSCASSEKMFRVIGSCSVEEVTFICRCSLVEVREYTVNMYDWLLFLEDYWRCSIVERRWVVCVCLFDFADLVAGSCEVMRVESDFRAVIFVKVSLWRCKTPPIVEDLPLKCKETGLVWVMVKCISLPKHRV